jgi:cytochrome c
MKHLLTICLALFISSVNAQDNTLSPKESKAGWKLLFDGKSLAGWRNFKSDKIGEAWIINDNAIHLDALKKEGFQAKGGGDLMTSDEFENYELTLDWKIGKCGNSGIIFNVVEADQYQYVWQTGPEMQVLDNKCHPDAKIIKHRAGDLYDLISSKKETVRPAGEWNKIRLVSNKGKYEFYMNGTKAVEFTMHTPEWNALVKGSKFKDMPDFGNSTKGRISLQDHGDPVWFKNIKIREIK